MGDKIIGRYAAGLSTRDMRAHLEEVYGLKVSADLVSRDLSQSSKRSPTGRTGP